MAKPIKIKGKITYKIQKITKLFIPSKKIAEERIANVIRPKKTYDLRIKPLLLINNELAKKINLETV